MADSEDALVPIDLELRFVLFGLECVAGFVLSAPEAERVFREAAKDRVSAKRYDFGHFQGLSITGYVDEYEPEEIRLRVEGRREIVEKLRSIVDASSYHAVRLRSADQRA